MKNRRFTRTAAAIVTASAMISSAAMPVMAASANDDYAFLDTAMENAFKPDGTFDAFKDLDDAIADGTFSVNVNVSYADELDVDAAYAQDWSAGTQSLSGTVSMSGMNIDFQEYFASNRLVVSVPTFMNSAVSYDFNSESVTGFLADLGLGDTVNEVNAAVREVLSGNLAGGFTVDETYSQAIIDAVGDIELVEVEAKDCPVGDGTVSCEGWKQTMTPDQLTAVFHAMMETPMAEGGQTLTDVLTQLDAQASAMGEEMDLTEALAEVDQVYAEMGEIDVIYYIADDVLREMDCVVQGTTVEISFSGEDSAWHHITMTVPASLEDEDAEAEEDMVIELITTIDGTTASYAALYSGIEMASFSYNTADGAFALASDGTVLVEGTLAKTDSGYVFSTEVEGIAVSLTISDDASVVTYDGDAVELTAASTEEVQDALGYLGQMLGIFPEEEVEDAA